MSTTNTPHPTLDNAVEQRAQAEKYLDSILKFRPITSSRQSYSRFLDIFVSSVNSLKDLDVGNLTEYILYSVAMRKLDFKTRSEFEVIVNNENVEPTVKELVNFLEKQQASKESGNADKAKRQRPRKSRNQNKRDTEKISSDGIRGDNRDKSEGENGNSTKDGTLDSANKRKNRSRSSRYEKLKCSDCETNSHPVESCEMFLKLTNDDRVNFSLANKICFTCLNPGHARSSCPQKDYTCEKCSSRHHVLLHTDTKRIRRFLIFKRTRSDKRYSNGRSGSVEKRDKGDSSELKPKNCILCNDNYHNLEVCEVFLGYDLEKRLVVIKENRLCVNCFEHNHISRRCPMKSNCDQCKGKHHAKAHEPENCVLCNEKYHNLDVCDIFNSYEDPETRFDVIKKNRLCANCFETKHQTRRCPTESNCDQCKSKHHVKVHEIFSQKRQSKRNEISTPENCILCNEKYHNLDVCDIFNSYEDPAKHLDVIRKNRLCANCFELNHLARNCPMESKCDQCKGKHHAKVHLKYHETNKHESIKRNSNGIDSTPDSAGSQPSEIVSNGVSNDPKSLDALVDIAASALNNVNLSN